jgi:hypothetical protein
MDTQKILICALFIALAWGAPAAAQESPPPQYNTTGVQSAELPAPLPRTPGVIAMPELNLPRIDRASWPSLVAQRTELDAKGRSVLSGVRSDLSQRYSEALGQMAEVRSVTGEWRSFLGVAEGGEIAVSTQSADQSFTMASVAQQMGSSIEFSVGYLRAITGLGPMGLDLAFVFVALAWVFFVNLSTFAIKLTAWLIRTLFDILAFIISLAIAIFTVVNAFLKAVDIVWPF